jgi:hypothetical protein
MLLLKDILTPEPLKKVLQFLKCGKKEKVT